MNKPTPCSHGRNFCLECHDKQSRSLPALYDDLLAENARLRSELDRAQQHAGGAVKDEFDFEYRHANGEHHTVTVSREQVIEQMPDFLFDALCDKFCNCEPIGETNVVECCCDEYAEEFQLLAAPVSGEQPQCNCPSGNKANPAARAPNCPVRKTAAQDVDGLVETLTEARQVLATALQATAPDWFKTEADIASHHTIEKIDGALAAHRAQLGEQP